MRRNSWTCKIISDWQQRPFFRDSQHSYRKEAYRKEAYRKHHWVFFSLLTNTEGRYRASIRWKAQDKGKMNASCRSFIQNEPWRKNKISSGSRKILRKLWMVSGTARYLRVLTTPIAEHNGNATQCPTLQLCQFSCRIHFTLIFISVTLQTSILLILQPCLLDKHLFQKWILFYIPRTCYYHYR